jgi:tetratricopeptide (TPR) repeat protein
MAERLGEAEFIGRERELGLLDAGYREACEGRGRALGIVGEPGIGKTRLVEEFTRRLDRTPEVVLWGRCPEGGGAPAYWPWRQALAPLLESDRPGAAAERVEADPQLQSVLAILAGRRRTTAAAADTEGAQFTLLEAIVRMLRTAADRDPLVIVLDDVHWADEASLKLLAHLVRELRRSRVLVVTTYREPEMRRRTRPLGEIVRFSRRIGLHGLARGEIERFVSLNGVVAPSEAMIARLEETTEGNPFFLDELVAMLRESGDLESDDDAIAQIELPDGIREAIRRRIDPLEDEDQALLELAAVIGREFSVGALAAASGEPADTVLGRLAGALAAGLLDEVAEPGSFRFVHALVRETLYAGLRPAARVAAHRRVALALERSLEQGADVALAALAHHFFLAVPLGEAAKAATYAERAGSAAMRQLAYDEAATQFDRAISALGFAGDDPPRRIRLLLGYGDALQKAGDMGRAAEIFSRAARLARDQGDAVSLAIAAMRHAFTRGAFLSADPVIVKLLETALAAVGSADHPLRVFLLTTLSAALLFSRERSRCTELCDEALAMARRIGDPTALANALMARHFVLLGSLDIAERLRLADEALALARQGGASDAEWSAWALRLNDLLELGDVTAVESESERLVQLADASRTPLLRWRALVAQACMALLAGRFADAERFSAEAIAARRRGQDAAVAQIFVTQSLLRRLETGGVGDHEEMLARFSHDFPDNRGWRPSLALVLAESGREDEARTLLSEIAALDFADIANDANFLGTMAILAILTDRFGDAPRARRLYERLAPFADRAVVSFIQPVLCLGSVARYLGLLAGAMGELDLAARHFEDAIAMNTRIGARPYLARSQAEYARCLLARSAPGDLEKAARLVAEARAIAGPLGQHRLREELVALAARSGEPRPPATDVTDAGTAVLKKEGDLWRVAYRGDGFHLKDSKGLQFLSTLLRNPGREVHVLDLLGERSDGGVAAGATSEGVTGDLGDAGEMLDPVARSAYKRRLDDLREELEEAERFNDVGRAERARHEMDFLGAELARGVGLGGRARRAGGASERARQNACRTIAAALKKIAEGSPGLGQHLAATVNTGLFCCYDPRLVPLISWTL